MTLGIGLLEQSGMISALMRKTILGAPSYLVTFALAIVGINANLASDAGIIFTPMIGATHLQGPGPQPLDRNYGGLCRIAGRLHGQLLHCGH